MMITNDSTASVVGAYQPTYGLSNAGSATGSSSGSGAAAAEDTVQLSTTAQVAALHTSGMSVKQIAASEGMTTQEVDSYLGITTTSAPSGGGGGGGGKIHGASTSQASSGSGAVGSGKGSASQKSSVSGSSKAT